MEPIDIWPVRRVNSSLGWLLVLLWAPFGIALCLYRLLLIVGTCVVLTLTPVPIHGKVLRIAMFMALSVVTLDHPENLHPERGDGGIMVASHVCNYDPLAIRCFSPLSCVLLDKYKGLPFFWTIFRTIHPLFLGSSTKDVAKTKKKMEEHCNYQRAAPNLTPRLLVFPEGGLTNGKGLMQFSKFVFGLKNVPIYPLAVSLTRPFFPVAIDTINGGAVENFFWWLYCPLHLWKVSALPMQVRSSSETDINFAQRVQSLIAQELQIEPTRLSSKDKRRFKEELLSSSAAMQAATRSLSAAEQDAASKKKEEESKRAALLSRFRQQKAAISERNAQSQARRKRK